MAPQADERTPLLSAASDRKSMTDPASGGSSSSTVTVEAVEVAATEASNATDACETPLQSQSKDGRESTSKGWLSTMMTPANRVLLAGFIISLSFGFTQVSIFYVFHLMECDVYYSNHPPYDGSGDRCSRNEIAAGTATQFSILGMTTTFAGTWNLFVSGQQVKTWGPRTALILQTSIPAIRVATQIVGVVTGGQVGIWIIQLTQAITILGGPAGYILVVNTIAGEIVPPVERTELFGKLQGCIMLGGATGFLVGGLVGDKFGIIRPFQTAFFLFCFSSIFARLAMPYISPDSLVDKTKAPRRRGISNFFQPLKVLLPQKIRLASGRIASHYGVFFLCFGNFLGVLATGYAPVLLQMYATAVFDFDQAKNGWLLSGNSFMRAIFLIFIFPRIISWGRKWFVARARKEALTSMVSSGSTRSTGSTGSTGSSTATAEMSRTSSETASVAASADENTAANADILPTEPEQFEAPTNSQVEEEPVVTAEPAADEEKAAYAFDLFFLRWSLLVDGILTAGAALATQGWHMYLLTVLLPFGSGSAPAAKGVITSMCPSSQRTDALNAITLVENIARLATLGLFGFIFSALAEIGQAQLTFYCNGAVAVIAMLVLMFSHFPPTESTLVDEDEEETAALLPPPEGEEEATIS